MFRVSRRSGGLRSSKLQRTGLDQSRPFHCWFPNESEFTELDDGKIYRKPGNHYILWFEKITIIAH